MRIAWPTALPTASASPNTPRVRDDAAADTRAPPLRMRRPPDDHARGRQQQEQRRGQHQLPAHAQDLIDADADEAPAYQVRSRKTKSAFNRNHTGPSHTGPGPDHAPRNRSAPRNDVPSTCAYSASWMMA